MNILALDDEEIALEGLVLATQKVAPSAQIYSFRRPKEALEFCKSTFCDILLLDIQMRNMSGIEFAKKIKLINPDTNIIFTTGYSDYMKDAFEMHASGYIMKPVTPEKIKKELDDLRFPVRHDVKKRMHFQTFGNFEVFIDGHPVKFKYERTKEVLAYLVDRNGALCNNNEIMAVLWGDKSSSSYFRSIIKDMKDTFAEAGCEDVIEQQRGKIGIIRDNVDCDYYDWLDGKVYAINLYRGEYMAQYSWSEMTNASIEEKN
ncbi:MAG: response regulator [Lachnospiraceae bacterium]